MSPRRAKYILAIEAKVLRKGSNPWRASESKPPARRRLVLQYAVDRQNKNANCFAQLALSFHGLPEGLPRRPTMSPGFTHASNSSAVT